MQRRTFLALLGLPAFASLVQACGSDSTVGSSTAAGVSRSDKPRMSADPGQAAAAAEAINAFGHDLYRRLAAENSTGNFVMSPSSIALAILMTSAGAVGATLEQMDDVLHVADPATIHRAMNALTTVLATQPADVTLSIANSLWGQSDLAFETPFLDLLATEYGAGMNLVDYRADPEAARTAINAWVDEQTEQRIPQLLPQDSITVDSRLTLVNAIYMKAEWANHFDEDATTKAPFTNAAGESVQVDMMHTKRFFGYSTGDGWQAVEVPYSGDTLSMVLIVPEPEILARFEQEFLVGDAIQAFESTEVSLGLPKFDIAGSFSLEEQLSALGMPLAFDDAGDFSAMSSEERVKIGAVIHQANITVDEFGTEAAAATAVVMEAGSAPAKDEPIELLVDRPFLFAVRDTTAGSILFVGRVGDPSLTRG